MRDIENFELSPKYYNESWINGNKTHVSEELAELHKYYPFPFITIFSELSDDIRNGLISIWGGDHRKYNFRSK